MGREERVGGGTGRGVVVHMRGGGGSACWKMRAGARRVYERGLSAAYTMHSGAGSNRHDERKMKNDWDALRLGVVGSETKEE
eukprot:1489403-Pleurochrysis_carterae.AAC.3